MFPDYLSFSCEYDHTKALLFFICSTCANCLISSSARYKLSYTLHSFWTLLSPEIKQNFYCFLCLSVWLRQRLTIKTETNTLKVALSGLWQFLAIENPLKMMKNAFISPQKLFFVLKILKSLSWPFSLVPKQLDLKDKIDLNFYKVTAWLANNCNTNIVQYLEK